MPARLSAYVPAFRALHLHRLQSFTVMLPWDVLNEPLFFNRQLSQPAASSATANTACPAAALLTPQQKPLSAGITKVAHLRRSLQLQQPQLLALELSSVLLELPPASRAVVSSAPASTCLQGFSASGRQLIQDAQTGQLDTISPHLQLNNPTRACLFFFFFFFFFFWDYRGIAHPLSIDDGTERTWFEPEQQPRKRVPRRSVHGNQSPQGASKTFWRQDDQPRWQCHDTCVSPCKATSVTM